MRWVMAICVAVLATALVSIAGTVIFIVAQPRQDVPLTTGLNGSWDSINRDFDTRVRTRFPLGSSERDMALELRREGFMRDDWSFVTRQADEAKAVRREDRVVCRQAAYVFWRANPQGRLTAVRGTYRVEACL